MQELKTINWYASNILQNKYINNIRVLNYNSWRAHMQPTNNTYIYAPVRRCPSLEMDIGLREGKLWIQTC